MIFTLASSAAHGLAAVGYAAVGTAARPAAAAVGVVRRAERDGRERATDAIGRATLELIDRTLASQYADAAFERVLESPFLERTIARTLAHAEAADAPQRIAERMLADGIAEQLAERLLTGPELERIVRLAGESEPVRRAIAEALESPGLEQVLELALESPGMDRLVTRVLESRVVDEAVARVIDEAVGRMPESQPLWELIDVIARSPAVTAAIMQQSVGFGDHVAEEVRDRSRSVDARLERGARRLLRRRSSGSGGAPSPSGAA